MDFESIFGSEALTVKQFIERLKTAGKDGKEAKLVDITQGGYISQDKLDAVIEARDDFETRLKTAEETISSFEEMDIETIKAKSDEYKTKAETAQADADTRVAAAEFRAVAAELASGISFSSASAKKAFLLDLTGAGLKLEDGKILGFDDFKAKYAESDPEAFASDKSSPPPYASGTGGSSTTQSTLEDALGIINK